MPTTPDQHVEAFDRLMLMFTILDDDMTTGLDAVGLTKSRVGPVWHLHQHGPCTQRDLADALGVSARNVTGLVDALVETGFVIRTPHPSDRRATLVSLTPHGRRVADGLVEGRAEFARLLFETMPPRSFTALVTGLDALLARLTDILGERR